MKISFAILRWLDRLYRHITVAIQQFREKDRIIHEPWWIAEREKNDP